MIIAYYKSIIVPCFKLFPLIHLCYFLEIFIQCILVIFTYLSCLLDPFLLFYLSNLEFSFFSYSEFICAAARLCLKDNIFFCLLLVLFCWYSCTNSVSHSHLAPTSAMLSKSWGERLVYRCHIKSQIFCSFLFFASWSAGGSLCLTPYTANGSILNGS